MTIEHMLAKYTDVLILMENILSSFDVRILQ